MKTYKLTLAYDGSRYYGWQRLPKDQASIQGKIEDVLTQLDGSKVEVHGSGRTDAGVHARGQVASFSLKKEPDCETVLSYLRQYLPEDIGALSVEYADDRFHARLNAKRKTYCYFLWTDPMPCVFERKYTYVLRDQLDIGEMKKAAKLLCGTHDYSAFCSNPNKKKSNVRTVERIDIERTRRGYCLTFTGDGFLYHMIRIMTGTLLEIGRGVRKAESVEDLFSPDAKREQAGFTVPAKGLCLMEVEY